MSRQQGGQPEPSTGLVSILRGLCVADRQPGGPDWGRPGDAPGPHPTPRRGSSKAARLPPPIAPCSALGQFADVAAQADPTGEAGETSPTSTSGSDTLESDTPSFPATPSHIFVHSPYCFQFSASHAYPCVEDAVDEVEETFPYTPESDTPSLPATPSHVFVHSPYSFQLPATEGTDPGTLGVEVPPMDPVAWISYTLPSLAGIGPSQRRKLLCGGDPVYVPPPPALAPTVRPPFPDSPPNRSIRTAKGDPEVQSVCPHPKPWKRRRAQRGFAFYVCLHCQFEWRVVTAKALRRRQELQAQAVGQDCVPSEAPGLPPRPEPLWPLPGPPQPGRGAQ
eukprot:EG_transcript_9776